MKATSLLLSLPPFDLYYSFPKQVSKSSPPYRIRHPCLSWGSDSQGLHQAECWGRKRGVGKVFAEVKFKDALGDDVVLGRGDDDDYDGDDVVVLGDDVPSWLEEFPKRWVIVILCFFAFLLCNMDRVNMSIAILPMSQEYNWNPATVGLIQSSFFWGYLLTQIKTEETLKWKLRLLLETNRGDF